MKNAQPTYNLCVLAKEIKPIRSRVYLEVILGALEPLIVFLAPLRLLDMDMKDMDDIRGATDTGKHGT